MTMRERQGSPEAARTSSTTTRHDGDAQRAGGWQPPAWLDHFNAGDMKMLLRCSLAAWAALVLIFIDPVLHNVGQALFLAPLLLFIVPPATTIFMYLLAALSLLIGMCLAWAWGLLAMKAALAARPVDETNARLGALRQLAGQHAQASNQTAAVASQILVNDGFMLDTRVTAIFYAFGCVFIYVLARLRCANPKLVVLQVFGIIVSDIFVLYGPTLPRFNAQIATVLVKPSAIGIGIGAVFCILLFPQSTSYVVLDHLEKLTRLCKTAGAATATRLGRGHVPLETLKKNKARFIELYKAMQPSVAFLPIDMSHGRWSAEDVKSLHARVREVMFTGILLMDFHITRSLRAPDQEERDKASSRDGSTTEKPPAKIGQRHRHENEALLDALQRPEHEALRNATRDMLQEATADVLENANTALELAANCIKSANCNRWFGRPSEDELISLAQTLQGSLAQLRSARETCVQETTQGLLAGHSDLFDKNGQLVVDQDVERPFLPSLIISMVLEERILGFAAAVESLTAHILQLTETRRTHRIWVPFRLRYAISWLFKGKVTIPADADTGEDGKEYVDTETLEEDNEGVHEMLRQVRGYDGSSADRGFIIRTIIRTCKWWTNPAGMYALRMVVVTIATSIPGSIPSSTGFFYREKGIWTVITAQTCLLVYMSDFTLSLVIRTIGTVIGGVMGMAAWYIGGGSGDGNPYGMAAISALITVIFMWWRLFLPPAFIMATIMGAATFCLVLGFSWDSTHIPQYGLPGKGYETFWKRMLTVLIGFAAAFIVQLFPSPPSATKHVCKTLSNTIRTLSGHFALLVSNWGLQEKNDALGIMAEKISLEVAEDLFSLGPSIAALRGELSFGPFRQRILLEVQENCQYLNQALGGLLALSASLPRDLQERFSRNTGILEDRTIGDIMAVLGIIEQSLLTGSPLPERLPAPLVRRAVDFYHAQAMGPTLTTKLIEEESYRRYCVAITLYLKFLKTIDDLLLALKGVLGERHIVLERATV